MCVATTIIINMGKPRYAMVTLAPLCFLVVITFTASWYKVFSPDPRIGFLSHARQLSEQAALYPDRAAELSRLIFNDRLDAVVTIALIVMVVLVIGEAARKWVGVVSGRREAVLSEAPFVPSRYAPEEV
jgi:carbon starvation protein